MVMISRKKSAFVSGWAWWQESRCRLFQSQRPGAGAGAGAGTGSAWALVIALALFVFVPSALARVGGGESYSGGHSGSGGGGGGELIFLVFRLLFWLTFAHPLIGIPLDIFVITMIVRHFRQSPGSSSAPPVVQLTTAAAATPSGQSVDALRRFDPNFSEITFSDFCYSLYGRAHHARGEGKLDQYAPYMSAEARAALIARNPQGLREVKGVVVGSFQVDGLRGLETPLVRVTVSFESNLTEVAGGTTAVEASWYLREQWMLERKRDILSPPPEKAKADHCPHCGAPLRTRTDGTCESCGVKIQGGAFQWYVRSVTLVSREERGPLLTSDVPEEGTSRPTVLQECFADARAAFEAAHPQFVWEAFEARVRQIATDLQTAWSSRNWEAVRPLETESLFQMHRYWIDAYLKQKLHNVVDAFAVTRVEPVKIATDAFYESITVRLWAQGCDHTDDESGRVVSGSKSDLRQWSEYWTLIRTRSAAAGGAKAMSCPNCGAPVAVGATGVCASCGGKLSSGDFDWILSRIEQDESYEG
jgi:ribosomal protein L37AE/L43A